MINKIIRYYNQNRKRIWWVLLICAMVILAIQLLNYLAKMNHKKSDNNNQIITYNEDKKMTQSVINDKKIDESTAQKNNNLIQEFVDFCNAGKVDSAYNLLSDDCKNNVFTNEENFKQNYYNLIFKEQKHFSKENWLNSKSTSITYKINYTNDLLADGYYKEENIFSDYITTVKENNIDKLNISNFIGSETLEKKYEDKYIQLYVQKKCTFMNEEKYEISIKNNTQYNILLYDIDSDSKWMIEDEDTLDYSAMDLTDEGKIALEPKEEKKITVRFSKTYNPDKEDKLIKLQNITIQNESNDKLNIEVKL